MVGSPERRFNGPDQFANREVCKGKRRTSPARVVFAKLPQEVVFAKRPQGVVFVKRP